MENPIHEDKQFEKQSYSDASYPVAEHEEPGHSHGHAHSHAARFTGQKMQVSDLVWKWSPQGNNRNQQVRVNWEYAQVSRIHPLLDP